MVIIDSNLLRKSPNNKCSSPVAFATLFLSVNNAGGGLLLLESSENEPDFARSAWASVARASLLPTGVGGLIIISAGMALGGAGLLIKGPRFLILWIDPG